MNNKIILLKKDCDINDIPGDTCYIKYLDKYNNYAVFYKPLIGPKYLNKYIKENNMVEGYILSDDKYIDKYKDNLYTFTAGNGVYKCKKGIKEELKYVLLVDKGMEIDLPLSKYNYEIKNNSIYLKKYKESISNNYLYLATEEHINNELINIMLPVYEVVPNVLNFNSYELNNKVKRFDYK